MAFKQKAEFSTAKSESCIATTMGEFSIAKSEVFKSYKHKKVVLTSSGDIYDSLDDLPPLPYKQTTLTFKRENKLAKLGYNCQGDKYDFERKYGTKRENIAISTTDHAGLNMSEHMGGEHLIQEDAYGVLKTLRNMRMQMWTFEQEGGSCANLARALLAAGHYWRI
ncbi:hypothetical protein SELMODRAFT_410992 [Selaginella moellendorffii]|uniref:Uncharacterized protein n=1 Tax=Selaginella moellendorffii TaxID=88036 RepID=D8RHN4_SELML|nr:hypothetical protein SELMODRAFT_410992 [Selaginella moellendorffii]